MWPTLGRVAFLAGSRLFGPTSETGPPVANVWRILATIGGVVTPNRQVPIQPEG